MKRLRLPFDPLLVKSAVAWLPLFVLLAVPALAGAGDGVAKPEPAAALERGSVSAAGRHEVLLRVTRFGRFAITVASSQGTALQLVDRMGGPGEIFGEVGARDGRVDVFLDRGEYLIVTRGHAKAKGQAKLEVHAFAELNAPRPPLLVEFKTIGGTLEDLQQVSYWVEVIERRQMNFEAAGRSLGDLRLWKDGDWLTPTIPTPQVVQPSPGKPLVVCRLSADLSPGMYLLTAYGGAAQPWAKDSEEHPLYLRAGIPLLPKVGRRHYNVSPFGVDRWRVPGEASYFRLELPEARPAAVRVGWFDALQPFAQEGTAAEIEKNSVPPVAQVSVAADVKREHVVTVSAPAGQPYVLQHFVPNACFPIAVGVDSGEYWLSTVHSGHPADSVDATGILSLIQERWDRAPREALMAQVVELGAEGWGRRANLLAPLSVFFRIDAAGKYEARSSGVAARFRFEPFLTTRPPKYQPPDFRKSGAAWDLDPGYYVLTADPIKKGIAEIAVGASGGTWWNARETRLRRDAGKEAPRASVRFARVQLEAGRDYRLCLNQVPEVVAGVVLRRLPVDLAEALPMSQSPSEVVVVAARASEAGVVRAETESGAFLDVSLDGGVTWQKTAPVAAGDYEVSVRHSGDETVVYSLAFEPARMAAETPLPAIPDAALAALPRLPELTDAAPRFFDLERQASASFEVRAGDSGLYRLQSSGLLATEGTLRTRTIPALASQEQNGVGRNFLLQQVLRGGDYQVTVKTVGLSAGHLGLELTRATPLDGGLLEDGIPARMELPAGEAVAYRIEIRKAGSYHLRAMGLGRTFRCRLEDARGWPVEPPNREADLTRHWEPGVYRLVVLPEAVAARVVTRLENLEPPPTLVGHGPHGLALGARVEHVWLEPEDGKPGSPGLSRLPDVWTFDVPARLEATIELSGEMQGQLFAAGDEGAVAPIFLPPGQAWKASLPAGSYRLEVVCSRLNNKAPYAIAVLPVALVAGTQKDIVAPAEISVAVGSAALVEIESSGGADVRASLYDTEGNLAAASDDRPGDWNFHLARRLEAGEYLLRVDAVGAEEATTTVAMRVPREVVNAGLVLPVSTVIHPGRDVHVYPLAIPDGAEFVIVAASAPETIGIAIETIETVETSETTETIAIETDAEQAARTAPSTTEALLSPSWKTLASGLGQTPRLALPLALREAAAAAPAYRLRVWSADRRGAAVVLSAVAIDPPAVSERFLASGITLVPVVGLPGRVGAVAVKLERPGVFRLERGRDESRPYGGRDESGPYGGDGDGVRVSTARDEAVSTPHAGLIEASSSLIWLVENLGPGGGSGKLRAARVTLAPGASNGISLQLRDNAECDLAPSRGPVLVTATALAGQPGVRVGERDAGLLPDGRAMAVAERAAVSVALASRHPVALVWPAGGSGEHPRIDTRLEQLSFAPPPREVLGSPQGSLGGGRRDGVLGPASGAARSFDLPAGAKQIRLALDAGIVAALSDGDEVASVHWGGGDALDETVLSAANRLTLLAGRAGELRFSIEVLALVGKNGTLASWPLEPGAPYEQVHSSAGTIRLEVRAPRAQDDGGRYSLHVRGAREDPVFVAATGEVARGRDLPLGAGGGTLLVTHPPGLVLGWIDSVGREGSSLWASESGSPATSSPALLERLVLPALIELSELPESSRAGDGKRMERAWSVDAGSGPVMLHLRAPGPLITSLSRGGAEPLVEAHSSAVVLDAYLPEGKAELRLRGLAGGTLGGHAEITATPVTPIGEGLGPEVLLAAGATRLFSFTVTRSGAVGIGVRSDSGGIECTLLSDDGERLGTGVAQMPDLEPGTYLISLHADAGGAPVRARPALAGIEPPPSGPPDDVRREYADPSAGRRSFSSAAAAASDDDSESAESEVVGDEGYDEGDAPEEEEEEEDGDGNEDEAYEAE